jgi:6-phosphofructokinase
MNSQESLGKMNAFYGQSGGVTAVINTTACAVIETARKHQNKIGKVFAGHRGIYGLLNEELYDTSLESKRTIAALQYIPGGVFGSCRYRLGDFKKSEKEYTRILSVLKAHHIGYFFYNGGNDSADTTYKIAEYCEKMDYPLCCIAIPKTIDNDLLFTDHCPGFASVAKYIATATHEMNEDIASMVPDTQVYILEVMGRNSGWIAASSGLAKEKESDAPHLILFPEIPFDAGKFLRQVDRCVQKYGYCFIVSSESLRDLKDHYLADTGQSDAFGHPQLSGVAVVLSELIQKKLHYKYRYSVAGYLERSARHLGAKVDLEHAYAVGEAAVEFALAGKSSVCPVIIRTSSKPYRWKVGEVALKSIVNKERKMPRDFITRDGFGITQKCRDYLMPFIQGEDFPPFENGLPKYLPLKKKFVVKKLPKDW